MSVPIIFLSALAGLIVSLAVGPQLPDGSRAKSAAIGVTMASLAVLLVCIALGLWEAWSPWELERR